MEKTSLNLTMPIQFFQSLKEWQKKRQNVFLDYSDINFDESNTTIKEFKHKAVVNELINLTKQYKLIEASINYDFLKNPDCEVKNTLSDADYKDPVRTKTCLIPCKDFKKLANDLSNLKDKQAIVLSKAFKNIKQLIENN